MTDDLPTASTMAPTGFRVHVWCKACRHSGNADLDALVRAGKGAACPAVVRSAIV